MTAEIEKIELDTILSNRSGRSVIRRILERHCNINGSTSASDPIEMAKLSARRDVGLSIIEEIKGVSPESYLLMIEEGIKEEVQNDRERATRRTGERGDD